MKPENIEFTTLSDEIIDNLNIVNKSLVLVSNNSNINRAEQSMNQIFKQFNRLVSIGNNAIINIDKNISNVSNNIEAVKEDVSNKIEKIIENNNENYDYTQQLIEEQNSQIRHLEETIDNLNKTIESLTELIKPPHITLDHTENARYLIENTKNSSGKSIKGLAITVQNVSAILERYDKLKAIK